MHKFTLFTIGLSIVVILVVAEVVVNDYLAADFSAEVAPAVEEELEVAIPQEEPAENSDLETRGDEADSPEAAPSTPVEGEPLPTVPDEIAPPPISSSVTSALLSSIGVLEPRVETASFQGLVFGLFDVSSEFSGFTVLEHQLLDGPNFIGMVYEIVTENELQTFGAYETLRQKVQGSSLGSVNENNNYGEASFYFNHSTKTSTVFLVVQKAGHVYALQYSPSYHGSVMKPLLEKL